ncbi:TonB-dependent receptor domain-containing protein [Flavobacterium granuli]|uniref:Outer membrane receptor protein involved in Fe transport n=1 Tax=Flavobacterium granuli TaxID=280093 RepID=A0ABU1S409_9FLAO|nr:TonB-dependent receptor [Flavobacterium granuli]MDR6844894.1 outer membrane receptor protein involved in Fe transport [Flavobacterium granuli]
MTTMKNWLLSGLLFLVVSTVFSQGKITGTITDGQSPLPGANVAIKGASVGASTGFDGKFTIESTVNAGQLIISYIGFENQTVSFSVSSGTTDLGNIVLVSNSNELSEIVVRSTVVDVAKDRKTPVAVSTIKASEIQAKLGTQEFPEVLKNTPSVYAVKGGGGFGDSRISIRGFSQNNIAVMINGVPVNDMENSSVYWSNWAGLSDVTSAMQVQRGLGSSKLAIASVGGTINILTKSSDQKEGGSIGTSFGNANYLKTQASYSTGKLENGLSASILYSHTMGDGYVDGTDFVGDNYFIALGYTTKDNKHDFQFTFTGAPQWHNQRSSSITIAQYQKYGVDGEPNIKYNSDWGYLNGEKFSMTRNYFHKPVGSFNWDYKINETSKLSTVLYGSWGRGGGARGAGGVRGATYTADAFRTADGLVDFDKIQAYNSGQTVVIGGVARTRTEINGNFQNSSNTGRSGAGTPASPYVYNSTSGISQISSINSHDWYGGVINFNKKFTENITWDLGVDARTYVGIHYQNLNNLLGADEYYDNTDINNPKRILTNTYTVSPSGNPFSNATAGDKINFYNDGNVNWYGAFTQLEYSKDNLTAFIQGAVSQQGFKRVDYFKYLSSNPLSSTDYENILGGNVKGGVNYNINEQHNVFANAGYYSKQPFFNAVYPGNASIVNPYLVNEKIMSVEGGYGFRSGIFSANVNVYYTTWDDRNLRINDSNTATNNGGYYDYTGISETHMGAEFEGNARITDKFKVNGMFSFGNWEYSGNANSTLYNSANEELSKSLLYLDNVKVGDAAQMTASLGASYEVLERVTLDANYNFNDNLYAAISPDKFTAADNKGSLELPSYGLVDAGFSYKMLVGAKRDKSVNFRLNVNNVFDEIYIAESRSNFFADDIKTKATATTPAVTYAQAGDIYNGIATVNQVFFGFGRTYNFSLRYDF